MLTCANNGDLVTFSTLFNCLTDVFEIFFKIAKSMATGTIAIRIQGNTIAVVKSDNAIVFSNCINESISCGRKTSAVT